MPIIIYLETMKVKNVDLSDSFGLFDSFNMRYDFVMMIGYVNIHFSFRCIR